MVGWPPAKASAYHPAGSGSHTSSFWSTPRCQPATGQKISHRNAAAYHINLTEWWSTGRDPVVNISQGWQPRLHPGSSGVDSDSHSRSSADRVETYPISGADGPNGNL